MKKITLLLSFLIASLGFSQELLTNGDFSNGTNSWVGTGPFSVVSEEGYFSSTNSGGNPWDTQLVQGSLAFTGAHEYTLTFKARAAANRTITVAIQNVGIWDDQFRQDFNLTTAMQTFTATFNATSTNGNVQIGFLMAGTGSTDAVYYDDVSLFKTGNVAETCSDGIQNQDETGVDCGGSSCPACPMPPAVAAPTPPARAASDVVSFYSDAYTDPSSLVAYDNFDTGWCGAAAVTGVMISGNNTLKKNAGILCHGIDFQSDRQDLSGFTHLHFDFYTSDVDLIGDVFNVKLVDFAGGGSEVSALQVNINGGTTPQLVANTWISVDVDITSLGGVVAGSTTRTDIAQIGINTDNLTNVWYDNIYVHKNTTLGTKDFQIAGLNVYPNPTQNAWNVKTKNIKIASIEVFDVLGKSVMSMKPNTVEATIVGSSLKTGLYFAKISTASGASSLKLVKQ